MSVQKIQPLASNELLQENQVAEMEMLYLGASFRDASNRYVLMFTVDEETWLQFKASVPKCAIVRMPAWYWTNGDPVEQTEKEKKQSGPYADYWEVIFNKRFWLDKSLWEVLEANSLDSETAKQLLHGALETTSLSLISPDVWEDWCATHELHNLFTMSRNARGATEGANAKAS